MITFRANALKKVFFFNKMAQNKIFWRHSCNLATKIWSESLTTCSNKLSVTTLHKTIQWKCLSVCHCTKNEEILFTEEILNRKLHFLCNVCVSYKTRNQPKPARPPKTSQKLPKTSQNHLKPPKTSQNHPKPPTASQNHPQRPKLPKTNKRHPLSKLTPNKKHQ